MNGILQSPKSVILLLSFFLAASVIFVGTVIAQESNCNVGQSGSCNSTDFALPSEPGNYTYTACGDLNNDTDTSDNGECTSFTVEISEEGGGANESGENVVTAFIDSYPSTIGLGEAAYFKGHGESSSGLAITNYKWSSNIDGILSASSNFSITNLSLGNHTISFTVTASDGSTSAPATTKVSVLQPLGDISIQPAILDFGEILAGGTSSLEVTITNTGDGTLSSLEATTTSTRLELSIDKTSLGAGESAALTVNLIVEADAQSSNNIDSISLAAVSAGQQKALSIAATYNIIGGAEQPSTRVGILVATPSTVSFGQLKGGETATQVVSIANYGSRGISELDTVAPDEITATLSKTSLGSDESATLTLDLTAPSGATLGSKTGMVDVVGGGGETVSISVNYAVGNESLACPTVEPPSCKKGDTVDSTKDETGCTVFVCTSLAVKKASVRPQLNKTTVTTPVEKEKGIGLPVIIAIIVLVIGLAFGLLIVAVREGWLDLNDYPVLKDLLRKIGILSLFEREVEVSRFTPRPPSMGTGGTPKPPAYRPPPASVQAQQPAARRQLTPEEKARLEKYMKEHPEYAAWVKKRYGLQ